MCDHSRAMVSQKARRKGRTTGVRTLEMREARSRDRACWRTGLSCIHRPVFGVLAGALALTMSRWQRPWGAWNGRAYNRTSLSIASTGRVLGALFSRQGIFWVIWARHRALACLSQRSVSNSMVPKTTWNVPLEASCLMNGLFCASVDMLGDWWLLWWTSVKLELRTQNFFGGRASSGYR